MSSNSNRDKDAALLEMEGGDLSVPVSVLLELRTRFTRSAETAMTYAELYNQKGEKAASERNGGMAFAFRIAAQSIAEELDRLGIPREGEKQK